MGSIGCDIYGSTAVSAGIIRRYGYRGVAFLYSQTDQGEVIYATEEGQHMAPYDASWVIDEYKEISKNE